MFNGMIVKKGFNVYVMKMHGTIVKTMFMSSRCMLRL
jgi:hypothetical protein